MTAATAAAPFVQVQAGRDGPSLEGTPSHTAGHVIACEDGGRDGVFASWRWDGATLTVENDVFGMHPLFYYAAGGRICVSTSIAGLAGAGVPLELDAGPLGVFLRLDMFLGEDTCFRGIKVLPPNSVLRWRDGTIEIGGGRALLAPCSASRAEAMDTYAGLFTRAVRRRLSRTETFAVPLSGGRDSRHILLELVSQGCRPAFCVTTRHYPPRNDEDARVAALVTGRLGLKGIVISPGDDRFGEQLACDRITNYAAAGMNMFKVVSDYLRPRVEVVYEGLGGDVLSAGLKSSHRRLALLRSGAYQDLFTDLAVSDEGALRCIVSPALLEKMPLDDAVARFSAELRRHLDAPNPWASFLFHNRTRRSIAQCPFALLSGSGTVFTPFLDRDLARFLLSLPPELTVDGTFHTETILRSYPQYADIPFEAKTGPDKPGAAHYRAWSRALAAAWAREPRHAFLNARFLIPRLGLSFVSASHAVKNAWYARWAAYLFGLEQFIEEGQGGRAKPGGPLGRA